MPAAPQDGTARMLTALLTDTLDPGYAAAARRRDGAPAPRGWTRRLGLPLALAAVGLLLTTAWQQTRRSAPEAARTRQALVRDVTAEVALGDSLQRRADALRAQLRRDRERILSSTVDGERTARQVRDLELVLAAQPVRGPGVVVTVSDATATPDPAAGRAGAVVDRVQDRDLQEVANALWAAGAEAVAIDGQRLGATTTIRLAGEAILVGQRPVSSPYEVAAVGDADRLRTGFAASATARRLSTLERTYGFGYSLRRTDRLRLPAAAPERPVAARPVPSGSPSR